MDADKVKHDLRIAMLGLAATAFQTRNPTATEEEAWAYARRYYRQYRERAITFLTILELQRQTREEALDRRN